MSLRTIVERLYKQGAALVAMDIPAYPISKLPTARGTFNVYDQYYIEHPWQKYLEIPDRDLTFLERVDKNLIFFNRSMSRYHQLGLVKDDILDDEDPLIMEAINRLPKEVREARTRRITRAFDLSTNQKILPRNQWTPVEDDVPYLRPYIQWVYNEMEEYDAERLTHTHIPVPPHTKYSAEDYDHGAIFKRRMID